MSSNSIFKGDSTAAFGNTFLTININNPDNFVISKAIFVCGCIKKTFNNPEFPLRVNFSSQETQKLSANNVGYLVVYDEVGLQKTCTGNIKFKAQNGVICNG